MDDFWCLFLGDYCCFLDCDGGDNTENDDKRRVKIRKQRLPGRRVTPTVLVNSKSSRLSGDDEQRLLSETNFADDDEEEQTPGQNRKRSNSSYDKASLQQKLSWSDLDCLSPLLFGDEMDQKMEDIPAVVQVETTDDAEYFCSDSISDINENRHSKSSSGHSKDTKKQAKKNLSEAVDVWIADAYPQVKEEATILSSHHSKSRRKSRSASFSLTIPERNENKMTLSKKDKHTLGKFSSPIKHRIERGIKTQKESEISTKVSNMIVRTVSSSCYSEPPQNISFSSRKIRDKSAKRSSSFSAARCFDPFESEISLSPKTVLDYNTQHHGCSPPSIILIKNSSSKNARDKKKSKKGKHKRKISERCSKRTSSSVSSTESSSVLSTYST